ncbi:hypothetical protein EVAR_70405_1 [Eumeta japonica]|uniref:Uncharacterized protein n=1 Tax=Eumeta variegata TaxID=151549 RepID=A0A4C1SEA9_EUMVA|nr:hypothetical protein EVAR_70405_1 [Eumeta japonica]
MSHLRMVVSIISGYRSLGNRVRLLRFPYNDLYRSSQNEEEEETVLHFDMHAYRQEQLFSAISNYYLMKDYQSQYLAKRQLIRELEWMASTKVGVVVVAIVIAAIYNAIVAAPLDDGVYVNADGRAVVYIYSLLRQRQMMYEQVCDAVVAAEGTAVVMLARDGADRDVRGDCTSNEAFGGNSK